METEEGRQETGDRCGRQETDAGDRCGRQETGDKGGRQKTYACTQKTGD